MVLSLRVPLQEAEHIKNKLLEKELIDTNYRAKKEDGFLYMAIRSKEDVLSDEELKKCEIVDVELSKGSRQIVAIPFKEALREILNEEEFAIAKSAYDHLGEIAIIEVPEELRHKEKEMAEALLHSNPFVKTVLRKDGIHDGVFRAQKMKYLAGKNTKIAEYKENRCTLLVNVEEVYFSARLSTERKRIAEQIRDGEDILVMFSGAAPYPCVFCKTTKAKSIVGVEINPAGHKYGLQNMKKNKCSNVELYCGDVREVVPKLNRTFDRIVMPLPKTAEEFLDVALPVANDGAIIHLYAFYHEDDFHLAEEEIAKYCKQAGKKYEIQNVVKAGQHAPRTWRICVDVKIMDEQ